MSYKGSYRCTVFIVQLLAEVFPEDESCYYIRRENVRKIENLKRKKADVKCRLEAGYCNRGSYGNVTNSVINF